jgi:hypothetical protein
MKEWKERGCCTLSLGLGATTSAPLPPGKCVVGRSRAQALVDEPDQQKLQNAGSEYLCLVIIMTSEINISCARTMVPRTAQGCYLSVLSYQSNRTRNSSATFAFCVNIFLGVLKSYVLSLSMGFGAIHSRSFINVVQGIRGHIRCSTISPRRSWSAGTFFS